MTIFSDKEPRTHIHQIRYSDEISAILEEMDGKSIHDKFENLVLYKKRQIAVAEEYISKLNLKIQQQESMLETLKKCNGSVTISADKLLDILESKGVSSQS